MTAIELLRYNSNSPLAYCPVHGLYVVSGLVATGDARLIFSHCSTNCPTCGSQSEILPGLYAPDGDNISLLLDPGISPEALEALGRLLRAVQAGELTPEDAQKEADKVHHGFGKLFNISQWSDQAKSTLYASIIGAIAIISAAKIASAPSQTIVIQQPATIEHVITRKRKLLGSTALNNHNLTHDAKPRPAPHHRGHH